MQAIPQTHERPTFLGVAPQFTVPDVVAAASYYCDVLGFENRGFFGEPPVFAMLGRGVVEFFFNQNPEMTSLGRPRAAVGYDAYIHVIVTVSGPYVLALSSGFMTYATDVHPDYARVRGEIAASATTLVLLPSLDYETCVAETGRRQLGRPFCRSAEREEEVIRQRFGVYRNLPAAKLETMKPVSEVVDAAVVNLLPNIRLQPTAAGGFVSRRG